MITPFGLQHVWLVRDLAACATKLDPASQGSDASGDPLHRALRGYFVRGSGVFTFVLRAVDSGTTWRGFAQAESDSAASAWRVVCLAPRIHDCPQAPTVWYRLLLHLCIAAGERQVQKLYACVEQDSPEEQVLRQASFGLYCHDSVWILSANATRQCEVTSRVRAAKAQDAWDIQRLCARLAPRQVRQAEGLSENGSSRKPSVSTEAEAELVLIGNRGDVVGWAAVSNIGSTYWLRLAVDRDEPEGAAELVGRALASIPTAGSTKVLCAVRDYQSGVEVVLGDCGFRRTIERSLLVKHTTVQVSESRRKLVPTLEKRAGVVSTTSHSCVARVPREGNA